MTATSGGLRVAVIKQFISHRERPIVSAAVEVSLIKHGLSLFISGRVEIYLLNILNKLPQ